MNTIAVIIARGGSQRCPRKNTRLMCGHPLVAWSIVQARCSAEVSGVYLSTEDAEITEIGERYGATVVQRPAWMAENAITAWPAFMHAIEEAERRQEFDAMVSILPTSPLRKPDDIDRGIRKYRELSVRGLGLLAVTQETTIYERLTEDICKRLIWDKSARYMTEAGGLSVSDVAAWKASCRNTPLTDAECDKKATAATREGWARGEELRQAYVPVEWWQQYDIDTESQFKLVEYLLETLILKGKGMEVYETYRRTDSE